MYKCECFTMYLGQGAKKLKQKIPTAEIGISQWQKRVCGNAVPDCCRMHVRSAWMGARMSKGLRPAGHTRERGMRQFVFD